MIATICPCLVVHVAKITMLAFGALTTPYLGMVCYNAAARQLVRAAGLQRLVMNSSGSS